jgi:hypothetical protein
MEDGLASPFGMAKGRADESAFHATVIAREGGRSSNRQRCRGYRIIRFRG